MLRLLLFIVLSSALLAAGASETVTLRIDGKPLATYQALPMSNPIGNADHPPSDFKGSNFIHPLQTPSGFTITSSQPADHLHHFGLWWPWKHVQDGSRIINCWELQYGEGIVQGRHCESRNNEIISEIDYLDRKASGAPSPILVEQTRIRAISLKAFLADGYLLDLVIDQQTAVDRPIVIPVYRYSGFAIRATEHWNKDNSTILTSEGADRYSSNFSKARWVLVQGKTDSDGKAGTLIMSHPDNRAHPEKLRTWDEQHDGAVFVNFNTVGDEPWTFLPGETYSRHYQLFVFDGSLEPDQAESIWRAFAGKMD